MGDAKLRQHWMMRAREFEMKASAAIDPGLVKTYRDFAQAYAARASTLPAVEEPPEQR
jgi:hypothetical protein